jgi:protein PhnA
MSTPLAALLARSDSRCELCGSNAGLAAFDVDHAPDADNSVLTCEACRARLQGGGDAAGWRCLAESIWTPVPAVQVLGWRLLNGIDEAWARDLLDQVFLEDEVLAWAQAGGESDPGAAVRVVDSNGVVLADGDSVTLIKDLDVKGAGFAAKRGTLVKNIRLGDDPTHVEGKVNGIAIYLKTVFLKKVI